MAIKKINITNLTKFLKKPWVPITLGQVENYDIKLLKYEGEYFRHKHEKHDEFVFVYDGKITIELEDNKEINLSSGEGVLIEKGTVHRSKSDGDSLVIVFERDTILSDFVKV